MTSRTLVLGATSQVGRELIPLLTAKGEAVRAATRDPEAYTGGGEPIRFDYEDPTTFAPALEGVDRIFYVSRVADGAAAEVAAPFLERVKAQGIRRLVNMTAMGVDASDEIPLRKVELAIEALGIPQTTLRPNWFMQNFSGGAFAAAAAGGALYLPAEAARVSFIDTRDIAAVAAAALTEPGHIGEVYTLTGPEALDHAAAARIMGAAAGKAITYTPIDEGAFKAALTEMGWPTPAVEFMGALFGFVRMGVNAPVSGDVEAVLGRAPIAFEAFAADHAQRWS